MKTPPIPLDEQQRLDALRRTNLLNAPRDAVFDRISELAARFLDTPISLISFIDEEQQWFKSRVGIEMENVPRAESFCGHALSDDAVMVVNDATQDERFARSPSVTQDPYVRFYAGVPLKTADGHNLGVLCVLDTKPRHDFTERSRETLRYLADIATAWIKMRESAGYLDATTGIYTRQRMLEVLQGELRKSDAGAQRRLVVVVDIAMPRQMQDLTQVMGYQHTEQFIVECINRVSGAIGVENELYRIGLFRFGFLIDDGLGSRIRGKLDQLVETLRKPFDSGVGILLAPSATMGVAALEAANQSSAEEVLRHASVAADDAWDSPRGWAFYAADSDVRRQRKFRLLTDLPAALNASDQLYLVYQPKIDLVTGACAGVEALLRWRHPTLGDVPPMELIEAAEKTALMQPLTDWVLDAALAQYVQWQAAGLTLQVAVNLSAYDLSDCRMVSRVADALHRHHLPGASLELEFTESALIRDLDAVMPKLHQLHALGVSTAIDDFGTGYCNLAYLQKLASSKIKIDRRFVQMLDEDPRDRTLTRAIVQLAHDLDYRIVAEGIETESAHALLVEWGCEQAQGYLFSKPLRGSDLYDWICRNLATTDAQRRAAPSSREA